jgi:hypothetical protein
MFTGTRQNDRLESGRIGYDNFFNPDLPDTTDFNISIPMLRSGMLEDVAVLDSMISANLVGLRAGDYILTDPVDTGGGAHGLFVIGWRAIDSCPTVVTTRYSLTDFTSSRQTNNTTPYVVDFTTAQSPVPRPFYCSMSEDKLAPTTGYFNRHDWYFYTLPDVVTLPLSTLWNDPNWNW